MFLCHRRELKWFLALFSLISSQAYEQLKTQWVLDLHTAWSGRCCMGECSVASMLESLLPGACSTCLLQLHLPSSQKSANLELLSLLLLEIKCVNGPLPSQLSHKNEQFSACNFHLMCFSTCGLFINMFFKVKWIPSILFLYDWIGPLAVFCLQEITQQCFLWSENPPVWIGMRCKYLLS